MKLRTPIINSICILSVCRLPLPPPSNCLRYIEVTLLFLPLCMDEFYYMLRASHNAGCHPVQLIDWWNEAAYLGFREPVVVHSNPSVGFPPQAHGDMETFAK